LSGRIREPAEIGYKEIRLKMHAHTYVTRKLHTLQKRITNPITRNPIAKINFSINNITAFHSTSKLITSGPETKLEIFRWRNAHCYNLLYSLLFHLAPPSSR
jgi:hypothetical protein